MKENRKIKTYGSLITILLILIVAVIGWSFNEKGGLQLDPDQEEGTLDGMSEKEIRAVSYTHLNTWLELSMVPQKAWNNRSIRHQWSNIINLQREGR